MFSRLFGPPSISIKQLENPTETECGICYEPLNKSESIDPVNHKITKLGKAVIHTGEGGAKHPIHRVCFYKAIVSNPTCPICRIPIPRSAFPDLNRFEWADLDRFGKKIVIPLLFSGFSASLISTHYGLSILMQSSLAAAAVTTGAYSVIILSQIDYINSIRQATRVAIGILFITGLSILGSAIASVTTRSPLANSCVTVLITLVALKGIYDHPVYTRAQQTRANY